MSFNQKSTKVQTKNLSGGKTYQFNDLRQEASDVVLSSMLNKDDYYLSQEDRLSKITSLAEQLSKKDPEFLAKLCVYVREKCNLRSVSHFLSVLLSENVKGSTMVRKAIRSAIQRPDDMVEMLAVWNQRHDTMVPNSLRRAWKDVLDSEKFGAFELKRYAMESRPVKLKDVVKLSHPKDTKGLFKQLIEDTLPKVETMETKMSTGESKAGSFKELLESGKLGYMAAIKNIRTAIEDGFKDIDLWGKYITDEKRIQKSKMLPFRYADAYFALQESNGDAVSKRIALKYLDVAFKTACSYFTFFEGKRCCVIVDESGSMQSVGIKRALPLALALYIKNPQTGMYFFAERSREVVPEESLSWVANFNAHGGGTYFDAVFNQIIKKGEKYDQIVILTDMELYANSMWGGAEQSKSLYKFYQEYRKISPDVKVTFWNVVGYGEGTPLQLNGNITALSGFSDKMLEIIEPLSSDPKYLIKQILATELR